MATTNTSEKTKDIAFVSNRQNIGFLVGVAGLMLLTFAFHLFGAKQGWSNYRDQHVGAALEYAKGNIDLLNPVIVGFNAGNTPTPQEFPIWQGCTAILFKLFGAWFGWANLVSLLFGVVTLWPLFQLASKHTNHRTAWWTLLFFVAQPLVFWLSGLGGTDGSCLTFMVWFIYFVDRMLQSERMRWFWPATVFGILCATTKAPFFFCAGLIGFFLLLVYGSRSLRRWIMLVGVGFISAVVFALWTKHTNGAMALAEFPFVDLRASGSADGGQAMQFWYFGDWDYRLNPFHWIKGGWRFSTGAFGSFALAAPFLWALFCSKNRLGQLWVAAGLITAMVFCHLVLHHQHYYLMFSPAVALLSGIAFSRLEKAIGEKQIPPGTILAFSVVLFLSTIQGLIGMKTVLAMDPYPRRIASLIREYTTPQDKLLIQGGGWGGEQLILSQRKGLSIWDTAFLEKPENLRRLKELGFTKLVMISESPLLLAVQQTNPGQANQQRSTYLSLLTPVTAPWNTVHQSGDILIKEIPSVSAGSRGKNPISQ